MRAPTIISLLTSLAAMTGSAVAAPQPTAPPDQNSVQVPVPTGKGRIGIGVLEISRGLRTFLGAPGDRGVVVENVRASSPGAIAGLEVGDVITEVDGTPVTSARELVGAISDRKKGDSVPLAVIRNHRRVEVQVTLEDDPGVAQEWPNSAIEPGDSLPQLHFPAMGRAVPQLRRELDAANKRIDQLEQRLDRLEHGRG